MRRFLWCLSFGLLTLLAGCSSNNPIVVMETSMGTVKMELYENDAPITVKNFLKYVDDKHYDGTIFHRVIKDFMIQGGGFTENLKERPTGTPKIKNESYNGLKNTRGTVAMARTPEPDSATDQFFINVKDNDQLNRKAGVGNEGYCVFGKVIEGMDVVDKIRNVPTHTVFQSETKQKFDDVPMEPVVIKSIRRLEAK